MQRTLQICDSGKGLVQLHELNAPAEWSFAGTIREHSTPDGQWVRERLFQRVEFEIAIAANDAVSQGEAERIVNWPKYECVSMKIEPTHGGASIPQVMGKLMDCLYLRGGEYDEANDLWKFRLSNSFK